MKEFFNIASKLSKSNNKFLNFANIVALFSVVVGSVALVISLSILNGFDNKLRDVAIKFTSHICTQTINGSEIENYDDWKDAILNINGAINALPVLQTEAIVTSPKYTDGVVLQTIDVQKDIKNFKENIVEGDFSFSSDTANEIIISSSLATKLNAKLGSKIMIYALKNNEQITFSSATFSQFIIKAIYNTGMSQYDNSVIFFPYSTLANFLEKSPTTATYFEVYVDNLEKVSEIGIAIDDNLGYPFFSTTYYEINRSIFAWIELQKEPIPIVLAIISLVAAMNIVTSLIITVVEKTHSIGILRTLGISGKMIVQIFVFLAMRTAIIGTFIGISLSLIFAFLQNKFSLITLDSKIYFVDKLPIDVEPIFVIGVLGLTLVFSLLASLIPSLIAAKISPVKAIRFK
jgi:lipoprotein-releasing system permease protein